MVWDVNQINQAFMSQALGQTPADSYDRGRLEAKQERLFDEDRAAAIAVAQRKLAAEQQKIADRGALMRNPTPEAYQAYYLSYPGDREAIKEAWNSHSAQVQQAELRTMFDLRGYLSGAKPNVEMARDYLQRRIAAERASGGDTSDEEEMLLHIANDPANALGVINGVIAAVSDPGKVPEGVATIAESQRADQLQPSAVRKAAADATTAEVGAQYAPQKAESDLATATAQRAKWAADTANEVARLALDRDKLDLDRDALTSTIQMKLEELDRNGTQLDAGGRTEVNRAVGESTAAAALADRMDRLADSMRTSGASHGWKAAFLERAKGAFGSQDAVSGLRAEYNQLVNAQAVKNLPPGPASDKDIQLAKQGFPPDTANAAYLSSFLRGMAKMQKAVADAADRRGTWISVNGSLAPARRDMDVGGVMVPAGTKFTEFNGNAVRRSRQGETPASLQSIINKYGR